MADIKAIVAVAENGVIGMNEKIPWHISEEFKHFKATTMGGIIVMGRRTWESLGGRPLPGRENVVISSNLAEANGAKVFSSLEDALQNYANDPRQIWICGGAKLYSCALEKCSEVILSHIKMSPEGNVFFPDISKTFKEAEVLASNPQFDVIRYVKR